MARPSKFVDNIQKLIDDLDVDLRIELVRDKPNVDKLCELIGQLEPLRRELAYLKRNS